MGYGEKIGDDEVGIAHLLDSQTKEKKTIQ